MTRLALEVLLDALEDCNVKLSSENLTEEQIELYSEAAMILSNIIMDEEFHTCYMQVYGNKING